MNIKSDLTLDDFLKMAAIEKKYYSADYIADYREAFDWYSKFSFTTKAVEDQGEIVGFLDLFPISKEIFKLLEQGRFNDKNLTTGDIIDIQSLDSGKINLFLCCVVIEKNYRKTDALKMLLNAYADFYKSFQDLGISIDWIITDNVTPEGERFSQKLGFKKLMESDHKTVVYRQKFKEFLKAVEAL